MKTMKQVLMLAFMAATVHASAQQMGKQTLSQLEESPAGSKIISYISMVNGGEKVTEQWVKKLFAPKLIEAMGQKKLSGLLAETREMEGQLHLYEARRTGMFRYKLLVKGVKSGEWLSMVFTYEEEEPYRIAGMTLDNTDAEAESSKPLYPVQ